MGDQIIANILVFNILLASYRRSGRLALELFMPEWANMTNSQEGVLVQQAGKETLMELEELQTSELHRLKWDWTMSVELDLPSRPLMFQY